MVESEAALVARWFEDDCRLRMRVTGLEGRGTGCRRVWEGESEWSERVGKWAAEVCRGGQEITRADGRVDGDDGDGQGSRVGVVGRSRRCWGG